MAPEAETFVEDPAAEESRQAGLASRRKARFEDNVQRRYSLQEVAKHDVPKDCWLIIRGKVYDVSTWVPKHPGGSIIFVKAGRDCTQLFESYHPLYVRKMLDFYIGDLERPVGKVPDSEWARYVEYCDDQSDASFYVTLKRRVEAYFKSNKINPRYHPGMILKSFLLLAGFAASFYATFFGCTTLWLNLLAAVLMGTFTAEFGISIMHDANHGAYTESHGLGYLMSLTLDLVGASSFMWRQQHVVGHHAYTNVDNYDPDIRVKHPDVRRVLVTQPWQSMHKYQHVYLAALYGLLAVKSVFLDDFKAFFDGYIGTVRVARMTPLESVCFWGSKVFYALYMLVLPAVYSPHPAWKIGLLYIVSQLITGWLLAFMFQVAHVVEEVDYPAAQKHADGSERVELDWAKAQVATTADFSPGSFFWLHFSGGLSYQVEHHLFPGFCHFYYPAIAPIVQQTCKEFDVPYHCFPTFWDGLKSHFSHLQKVGLQGLELRLDG